MGVRDEFATWKPTSSRLRLNPFLTPHPSLQLKYVVEYTMDSTNNGSESAFNPQTPLVPPPPFADFDFTFGGAPNSITHSPHSGSMLPSPPRESFLTQSPNILFGFDLHSHLVNGPGVNGALPNNSAPDALLSTTEQTDLLGFLDRFEWEFDPVLPQGLPEFPSGAHQQHHLVSHSDSGAGPSSSGSNTGDLGASAPTRRDTTASSIDPKPLLEGLTSGSTANQLASGSTTLPNDRDASDSSSRRPTKRRKSSFTMADETSPSSSKNMKEPSPTSSDQRAIRKPLLSQPQKRLNHIMSEQRRRTAIKEGFSTIEKLIAPDPSYTGPPPTLPIPLDKDGKPKKGVRTKALRGKGKMGSLFRAAEFLGFLEESVKALTEEVERLEAASGMNGTGAHHAVNPSHLGLEGLVPQFHIR